MDVKGSTRVNQLKPYLKPYLKETILAPLFKLFEAILELFVPLIMAVIIDKGIGNKDTSLILRQGAILIGLGILGVVVSITAQYFAAKAATGFTADVRQALFSKIQYFSFSQLDALGNDTLLTRLTSDINLVQNGLNIALRLLLRSPFIVGGAIVMAFVVNVEMAWTFCYYGADFSYRSIRYYLLDDSDVSPCARSIGSDYATRA